MLLSPCTIGGQFQVVAMKIVAGLARVSTEDQAYQVALSNQIQRLRDSGCDRVYADIASRSDNARAGLLLLIADIESGFIKEVRVTRMDRLTASPGLFERLVKLMRDRSIPLTGLDESINILDEDGEFFAGLGVFIAKREVQTIRKRSQKGHESRRNNSRANVVLPWGYTTVDRQYKLDHTPFLCLLEGRKEFTRTDLARDCINLFFEAKSLSRALVLIHGKYGIERASHPKTQKDRGTAKSFVLNSDDDFEASRSHRTSRRGVFQWSHKGLRNWLLSPVLRGHTPYNTREFLGLDSAGRRVYGKTLPQEEWDIHLDTHPEQTLLTEDRVLLIQQMIDYNAQTKAKWLVSAKDRRYPVSGLLICQACNAPLKSQASKQRGGEWRLYYKCKNAIAGQCSQKKSVRSDRAEAAIIDALIQAATRIDALRQAPVAIEEPPELGQLRDQLAGLTALGSNPAFDAARSAIEGQIKKLEFNFRQESLAKFQKQESAVETLQSIEFWSEWTADEKMKLFRWLVDAVWCRDGQVVSVDLEI